LSSDPNPAVLLCGGGGGGALTVLVFVDDEDELELEEVFGASETVETFAFCCF
jgi:hypothetical protein